MSAPPFNQRAIAVNITKDKVTKKKERKNKKNSDKQIEVDRWMEGWTSNDSAFSNAAGRLKEMK